MFGKSKEIGTPGNSEYSAGDGWADLMNGPGEASVPQESGQDEQPEPSELTPKEPIKETENFNSDMFERSEVNPEDATDEPPEMQPRPVEDIDLSVIKNADRIDINALQGEANMSGSSEQPEPSELAPKEPIKETESFNPDMFERSEVNPGNMTNEAPQMQQRVEEDINLSAVNNAELSQRRHEESGNQDVSLEDLDF